MPCAPKRPAIFASYAQADEPEKPGDGEMKWLSFVLGFLRPAVRRDAVEIWLDPLAGGGGDLDPEIVRKLNACDIFVLLISCHALSCGSVDREIAIIRERQRRGDDVHFYPLLLTPAPEAAVEKVRDKNLRPRGGRPFSDLSPSERDRRMAATADEIAQLAAEIAGRASSPRSGSPPLATRPQTSPPSRRRVRGRRAPIPEINDQELVEVFLKAQSPGIVAAIASRSALRTTPVVVRAMRKARTAKDVSAFLALTRASFRASALARVAIKYPIRANEFNAVALVAAARADAANALDLVTDAAAFGSAAHALAAAAAAADAAADSAAIASPLDAADAAPFTAAAAAADPVVRAEILSDALALQQPRAPALADLPLWSRRIPDWIRNDWEGLKWELPGDEGWDVWIHWYEDRLVGGSRGEAYELVFANVPLDVCNEGAAAANAWIKAHLPRDPGNRLLPPPGRS